MMFIGDYEEFKKRFHYYSVLTNSNFVNVGDVEAHLINDSNLERRVYDHSLRDIRTIKRGIDCGYRCNFGAFTKTYNLNMYQLDNGEQVIIPMHNRRTNEFPYLVSNIPAFKDDGYIRKGIIENLAWFVFKEYERGLLFKNTKKSNDRLWDEDRFKLLDLKNELMENQVDFYYFMVDNIETISVLKEL